MTPTDPEKDQHVYSGAEWEDLCTQRFAPHRPHRERHESGILCKHSGGFFLYIVFAPAWKSYVWSVNFDDLLTFSCHLRVKYFPVAMISFHFWYSPKKKMCGLPKHDTSQYCCDCVSTVLSEMSSHTFIRATIYAKNITSPSAVLLMLI